MIDFKIMLRLEIHHFSLLYWAFFCLVFVRENDFTHASLPLVLHANLLHMLLNSWIPVPSKLFRFYVMFNVMVCTF